MKETEIVDIVILLLLKNSKDLNKIKNTLKLFVAPGGNHTLVQNRCGGFAWSYLQE